MTRPSSSAAVLTAYLDEITATLHGALGDRLVAAWQVGSGALGDFDPERSDIDVQAVSAVPLPRASLEALAASLSAVPCPVRGLEFVLYARDELVPPMFALNLNTGPGMTHHEGYDPAAEERFWFVLDAEIARQDAVPLAGPHPAAVLPALPRSDVVQAHRDALAWWRRHDATQAVLAACRAWAWADTGRWLSKGAAASWATARLKDPTPVARALAHRAGAAAAGPSPQDVAAVVDRVLQEELLTVRR